MSDILKYTVLGASGIASTILFFPQLLKFLSGFEDETDIFKTHKNCTALKILRLVLNTSYEITSHVRLLLNPTYSELAANPPTISKIIVYPIKSCGPGLSVDDWEIDSRGLKHDRQFSFARYNEKHDIYTVVSQKFVCARLALLRCRYFPESNCFEYTYPLADNSGHGTFQVPADMSGIRLGKPLKMSIWSNGVECFDVSHLIPQKVFEELGLHDTVLAYTVQGKQYKDTSPRVSAFAKDPETRFGKEYRRTNFQDYFPIHIVTKEDLDDLNTNIRSNGFVIDNEIVETAFRPNLLLAGTKKPMDMDSWNRFYIRDTSCGETHYFTRTSRCVRCHIPDVDPVRGEKVKESPVYKTMMKYRRIECGEPSKPSFGNYCVQDMSNFKIHVSDTVHVISRKITVTEWNGGGLVHH